MPVDWKNINKTAELAKLRQALLVASSKASKLSMIRASLPPGTTRARVTTANARWARAAEERERLLKQIQDLELGENT